VLATADRVTGHPEDPQDGTDMRTTMPIVQRMAIPVTKPIMRRRTPMIITMSS